MISNVIKICKDRNKCKYGQEYDECFSDTFGNGANTLAEVLTKQVCSVRKQCQSHYRKGSHIDKNAETDALGIP